MTTLPLTKSISGSSLRRGFPVVLLVLGLFALSSAVRAVDPPPDGGYPGNNTAEGDQALFNVVVGYPFSYSGTLNTANGFNALYNDTSGRENTAIGWNALFSNTIGNSNTATGLAALYSNTDGRDNTATGAAALTIGLLFFQPRAHYIHGLAQYRLGCYEEAEHAFLLCVRQAPFFSASFRMLGEIARWHKKDPAEQALYQVKVLETRCQLTELRKQKGAEAHAAVAAPPQREKTRPLPELRQHPETLAGVPAEEVITIVSGLPRSGTSLMMQILEAAGVPPFTDSKRQPDESNRKGYYEHDKVASLLSSPDKFWLREAKGTAIKVVVPLLAALPPRLRKPDSEPELLHYRILFMERDIEEILQSQNTVLQRLGKSPAVSEKAADISKVYREQERHGKKWCANLGVHAMSVSFQVLVHHPEEVLPQLASFLGVADKLPAMRNCIDPALHRMRKIRRS